MSTIEETTRAPGFVRDRLRGRTVLVTGAARGQGRSHAVRLAQEGADIIAIDACGTGGITTAPYPFPTEADLAETARMVEGLDRRVVTSVADIRDHDGLRAVVDEGVAALGGGLDGVVANAGIASYVWAKDLDVPTWTEMIDVNLTGVFNTAQAVIPHLVPGSSFVITSSTASIRGNVSLTHYSAAKFGVVGMMKSLAKELAPQSIRVNCVAPSAVNTPMFQHDVIYRISRPELPEPTEADIVPVYQGNHILPVPWVEPGDLSNAVLFLLSDESRYVTGVNLPVDAGRTSK